MRYRSRVYGDVDWPLWHDVVIIVAVLAVVAAVVRTFG